MSRIALFTAFRHKNPVNGYGACGVTPALKTAAVGTHRRLQLVASQRPTGRFDVKNRKVRVRSYNLRHPKQRFLFLLPAKAVAQQYGTRGVPAIDQKKITKLISEAMQVEAEYEAKTISPWFIKYGPGLVRTGRKKYGIKLKLRLRKIVPYRAFKVLVRIPHKLKKHRAMVTQSWQYQQMQKRKIKLKKAYNWNVRFGFVAARRRKKKLKLMLQIRRSRRLTAKKTKTKNPKWCKRKIKTRRQSAIRRNCKRNVFQFTPQKDIEEHIGIIWRLVPPIGTEKEKALAVRRASRGFSLTLALSKLIAPEFLRNSTSLTILCHKQMAVKPKKRKQTFKRFSRKSRRWKLRKFAPRTRRPHLNIRKIKKATKLLKRVRGFCRITFRQSKLRSRFVSKVFITNLPKPKPRQKIFKKPTKKQRNAYLIRKNGGPASLKRRRRVRNTQLRLVGRAIITLRRWFIRCFKDAPSSRFGLKYTKYSWNRKAQTNSKRLEAFIC